MYQHESAIGLHVSPLFQTASHPHPKCGFKSPWFPYKLDEPFNLNSVIYYASLPIAEGFRNFPVSDLFGKAPVFLEGLWLRRRWVSGHLT